MTLTLRPDSLAAMVTANGLARGDARPSTLAMLASTFPIPSGG